MYLKEPGITGETYELTIEGAAISEKNSIPAGIKGGDMIL